jgi:hypothetical protein
MALGSVMGPTFGTIAEGLGATMAARQGSPTNLGRFALRQIPVAGSTLQNTLFPYKPAGRAGTPKDSRKALENYLNKMGQVGGAKTTSPVEKYLQKMAR